MLKKLPLLFVKERILTTILSILLVLIVLAMPYGIKFLPTLLSLSFLVWFISCFYPKKINSAYFNDYRIYLLPAFALFSTLSLLWSTDAMTGAKVLERMISFLILPLLVATSKQRINSKIENVYLLMGISILVSTIVLFIRFETIVGFEEIASLDNPIEKLKFFRYYIMIHSISLHPSYLSYFILIYLSYTLFKVKTISGKNIFHLIVSVLGIVLIIMLYSRGALLTLLFLFLYALIKNLYLKKYILFTFLFLITVLSTFTAYKYTRLGQTIQNLSKDEPNKQKDARIIVWQNAFELIKKKPLLGYGIGDAIHVMVEKHKETHFEMGIEKRLDAHNQFLETWLQSGIIGFVMLLLIVVLPLYQSIRKKQELLFLFLMVSFIQFSFESIFVRLAGVVYFAFFYCYLYYIYYSEEISK